MDKAPSSNSHSNQTRSLLTLAILPIFAISSLALILDQWSKALAGMFFLEPLFFSSWFKFKLEKNYGIAFSIPLPPALLLPLNLLIFLVVIIFLCKKLNLKRFSSQLIIAL